MAEQPIIVKKKIVKGHGHHGGSWKVAYADFVTAMMAFFMVMWLMSMSQDVKDEIQGYFNDPLGFTDTAPKSRSLLTMEGMPKPKPAITAGKGSGDNAAAMEQRTMQEVKSQVEKKLAQSEEFKKFIKDIKISITAEGLLIEFIEAKGAVFFESGSSKIRPDALRIVSSIAPILTASKHVLEVQGHTDAQPFQGRVNGNWALSSERALSLQEALEGDKVPDGQFSELRGFGPTQLLDPTHPLSYINRRVTILLPRKYQNGDAQAAPADALRSAVVGTTEPQAVMLQPNLAADMAKKGH
jgi:chemotaxis protein MotB